MVTISKAIEAVDRKAQSLISDILTLMDNEKVRTNPDFLRCLQDAYKEAQEAEQKAKSETRLVTGRLKGARA